MNQCAYRCVDPLKQHEVRPPSLGRRGGRVLSTHQMVNPALQNSGARTTGIWVGVVGMFEPIALKIL